MRSEKGDDIVVVCSFSFQLDLRGSLSFSLSFSLYLSIYLPIYLSISLS